MRKCIFNASVVNSGEVLPHHAVFTEEDRILAVLPMDELNGRDTDDGETLYFDARGGYVMPGFIDARYMNAEEAVRLIRDCGGLAILAHPFQYDTMGFLPWLVELGLSGIEYKHPTQSPERQRVVQKAVRRYGLFLTGGSDFHGLYSESPVLPGVCCASRVKPPKIAD
jgi:hypothetical protein